MARQRRDERKQKQKRKQRECIRAEAKHPRELNSEIRHLARGGLLADRKYS